MGAAGLYYFEKVYGRSHLPTQQSTIGNQLSPCVRVQFVAVEYFG